MNRRFAAFSFDDGRPSDFAWVAPLFTRYGARATFNIINAPEHTQPDYVRQVNRLIADGHEIGDHTVLHHTYMYEQPLCDGRTTPSNDDLRLDRGDGRNVFHSPLHEKISESSGVQSFSRIGLADDVTWGTLTDEDCAKIRSYYGVWGHSDIMAYLDELSARYCGTKGSSTDPDSWNGTAFTKGIFAGCRTTGNHEIWERLLEIQQRWYTDHFRLDAPPTNWSQPGGERCPCLLYSHNGKRYFDPACTILANHYGKLTSSRTGQRRSWADLLKACGYLTVSDSIFESQLDGSLFRSIMVGFHANAHYSKDDIVCREPAFDRLWFVPAEVNAPDQPPLAGSTDWLKTIYETEENFKQGIDNLVQQCARGCIPMGLYDSIDTFGARLVYELYLQFCQKAGIASVTFREAYGLAFKQPVTEGNFFRNPGMERTVFSVISAANAPEAPDGWTAGQVEDITLPDGNAARALVLAGTNPAEYFVYGIPPGTLDFTFLARKGSEAKLTVKAVRNIDPCHQAETCPVLAEIAIDGEDWQRYHTRIVLEDALKLTHPSELSPTCDGLDNKICGLAFTLEGEGTRFAMPNLVLQQIESAEVVLPQDRR